MKHSRKEILNIKDQCLIFPLRACSTLMLNVNFCLQVQFLGEREQFAPKTLLSFQIEDAVEDTFLAPTFVLGHVDIFISILCTEKKNLVFE